MLANCEFVNRKIRENCIKKVFNYHTVRFFLSVFNIRFMIRAWSSTTSKGTLISFPHDMVTEAYANCIIIILPVFLILCQASVLRFRKKTGKHSLHNNYSFLFCSASLFVPRERKKHWRIKRVCVRSGFSLIHGNNAARDFFCQMPTDVCVSWELRRWSTKQNEKKTNNKGSSKPKINSGSDICSLRFSHLYYYITHACYSQKTHFLVT